MIRFCLSNFAGSGGRKKKDTPAGPGCSGVSELRSGSGPAGPGCSGVSELRSGSGPVWRFMLVIGPDRASLSSANKQYNETISVNRSSQAPG